MQFKSFMEALKGKQHKIDKNKNGKIDAHDFQLLRKEETEQTDESFEFNRAALAKQRLQNLRHSGRKVRGASVANLMRAAGIREEEMDEEDLDRLDEVLGKDATASDWIHDFVHSTNPKFEGKTKKERIKMALGAYYGQAREKQQMESVESIDELNRDTLKSYIKAAKADKKFEADTQNTAMRKNDDMMASDAAQQVAKRKEGIKNAKAKLNKEEVEFDEAVQKADIPAYLRKQQGQAPLKLSDLKRKDTISDKENLAKLRNEEKDDVPFDPPYKKVEGDGTTTDKSGAKHTPMSKVRHLARQAMKKQVKEETDTSEKHEMAETQLHFIKYAAEEILEYIKMGGQIEEWYQNKLSKVQSEVESLHSYIEGESRRQGIKEETKREAKPVNVDKVHAAGQEPHEEKFETYKKKTVKEEFDEDGNITYSKVSFRDFADSLLEGRAQYMVKATHKDTGRVKVTTYVADKDESEYGVRSRAEREHKPGGYQIDSIRRKDVEAHGEGDEDETSSTQKRGRGRPAGAKSGARGPRIK